MDLKTELFNIYRSEDFPEYDDFMHLLEKALNLPECSLVKRVNGQAETDVSQESEEKEQVGRACRELELALAANLTKSNLRKASDAISTIAKMLNDAESTSDEK